MILEFDATERAPIGLYITYLPNEPGVEVTMRNDSTELYRALSFDELRKLRD